MKRSRYFPQVAPKAKAARKRLYRKSKLLKGVRRGGTRK